MSPMQQAHTKYGILLVHSRTTSNPRLADIFTKLRLEYERHADQEECVASRAAVSSSGRGCEAQDLPFGRLHWRQFIRPRLLHFYVCEAILPI